MIQFPPISRETARDKSATVSAISLARFSMVVCFIAACGLLMAGLVRSMPSAELGTSTKATTAVAAHNPK